MSRHIGSIQLLDEMFLPRVQETLHIEHAFVAFGFLKVIELMSREGDSRNVTKCLAIMARKSSRLLGLFFVL